MHERRKSFLLFALLTLVVAVAALWYWLYIKEARREQMSNASFVMTENNARRNTMRMMDRTQPPLSDANGNAGTHPPQSEIYYGSCRTGEGKNAEGGTET